MEGGRDPLAQAAELDDEACSHPEGSAAATELRRRAAGLRVEALGPRSYPVLVCDVCFRLTGWTSSDGACAADTRRRLERSDPNRLLLPDARPRPADEPVSALRRLKRGLGIASERDRVREWMLKVVPGETGPTAPEEGWEVEWPVKSEGPLPEGAGILVTFDVESFRFEDGAWRRVDVTRGGKPAALVPRDFPASLPIEALADAWKDFREEVAGHNARVWRAEQDRWEAGYRREVERRLAEDEERGTSGLLDDA